MDVVCALVEKSEKLRAHISVIEAIGRKMNHHQQETVRHQGILCGYHQGFAHADMITSRGSWKILCDLGSQDNTLKLSSRIQWNIS